ncbi:helix-turn-helix transcriptional regulator [Psychromonas aquimarina]|uniref:helix-turn-helix transcriptional regulator n=1 Tax=Psychromonas aquimarina TaxID=444919 RepID=UPI0003F5537F|nr:AlpA family phage regulatory protein [Psychromonas aquimarina]
MQTASVQPTQAINNNILSITDVCEKVNRSRTTLWIWVNQGLFPKPIKMGRRTLGWKEVDFNNWLDKQSQEQ